MREKHLGLFARFGARARVAEEEAPEVQVALGPRAALVVDNAELCDRFLQRVQIELESGERKARVPEALPLRKPHTHSEIEKHWRRLGNIEHKSAGVRGEQATQKHMCETSFMLPLATSSLNGECQRLELEFGRGRGSGSVSGFGSGAAAAQVVGRGSIWCLSAGHAYEYVAGVGVSVEEAIEEELLRVDLDDAAHERLSIDTVHGKRFVVGDLEAVDEAHHEHALGR
mmetsp:Transcript_18986/g.43671  ORF Transcript_18986/g.43671 Transcript_18986/m.43671 type:complete len:228 (-) Transcript_18986:1063-1746(-)